LPAYTTTLSSLLGSDDYAQQNDLIGKLAAAILMAPCATLISDNDPVSSMARIVTIRIGDSAHYIQLTCNSTTSVFVSIRNIANTGNLQTPVAINLQNYPLKMVYSAKALALNLYYYSTQDICYVYADDGHMYFLSGGGAIYLNTDNTYYNISSLAPNMARYSDGKMPLFPCFGYLSSQIKLTLVSALAGLYNGQIRNIYYDGTNYYYCPSSMSNVVIQDTA